MLGVLLNALAILLFTVVGKFLGKIFTEKLKDTTFKALGLMILVIGIQMALDGMSKMSQGVYGDFASIVLVFALVIGTIFGVYLKLQEGMYNIGVFFERKFSKQAKSVTSELAEGEKSSFASGFVAASVIFCAGAMGVLGSIQAGLGNHSTLFLKAALDGATALILAAALGWGVALSALSVLVYQGLIVIFASLLAPFISPDMVAGIGAVGGVMIMGIGFNMLGYKEIPIMPMLPSIILVVAAAFILKLFV